MSAVNLTLTNDTAHALRGAAALVNTLPGPLRSDSDPDRLTTAEELNTFLAEWRWTGSRTQDDAELRAVRALRPRLRSWWTLAEADAATAVNAELARARAVPQLVDHDGWGWHLHATVSEAPLATRMAVEAAMAFVDLIRAGQFDRLGVCAAPDCADVVVDLSKNHSRRYCERGCGNRAAVAAYRERRRAERKKLPSLS